MSKWIKNIPTKILAFIGFAVVTIVSYTWAVASVYNMVLDHDKDITAVKAQIKDVPADISSIKTSIQTQGDDIKIIKNYLLGK